MALNVAAGCAHGENPCQPGERVVAIIRQEGNAAWPHTWLLNEPQAAGRAGWAAWALAIGYASCTVLAMIFAGRPLVGIFLSTLVQIGFTKISLSFVDTGRAEFADLFNGYPVFVSLR